MIKHCVFLTQRNVNKNMSIFGSMPFHCGTVSVNCRGNKHTVRRRRREERRRRIMQGAHSDQWPITGRRAPWKQSAHGLVCRSMCTGNGSYSGARERERACPQRVHTYTSLLVHLTPSDPPTGFRHRDPVPRNTGGFTVASPWWSAQRRAADLCAPCACTCLTVTYLHWR